MPRYPVSLVREGQAPEAWAVEWTDDELTLLDRNGAKAHSYEPKDAASKIDVDRLYRLDELHIRVDAKTVLSFAADGDMACALWDWILRVFRKHPHLSADLKGGARVWMWAGVALMVLTVVLAVVGVSILMSAPVPDPQNPGMWPRIIRRSFFGLIALGVFGFFCWAIGLRQVNRFKFIEAEVKALSEEAQPQ